MATKNASTACDACRRARRKCTGIQPCDACLQRNIDCVLGGAASDGRSRTARKRKVEDLENDSNLLNDLLQTVQNSSDEHAASILALMRSDAPMSEIKLSMKRKLRESGLVQSAETSASQLVRDTGDNLKKGISVSTLIHNQPPNLNPTSKAARLIDSPPIRVPLHPWTSVTTDEVFVCHALSSWLMWDKPFYNWIDEDLFLRDMRKGEVQSQFCSPFLVNALLAYACHFADYSELNDNGNDDDLSSLAGRFVQEAMMHMLTEKNSGSITFVQGLLMMFMAVSCTGDDSTAYGTFAMKTAVLCRELELRYADIVDGASTTSELELAHALDTLCWGAFNLLSMLSTISHQLIPMSPPSRSIPLGDLKDHEWTPYPQRGKAEPSFASQLLHVRSKLSIIAYDLAAFLHEENIIKERRKRRGFASQASKILDDLQAWQCKLPEFLLVSTSSAPPVLIHQSYYLSLVLSLCACRKLDEVDQSEWNSRAKAAKRQSALQIVELFRIYRSNYGITYMSSFVIQPILQAVHSLLQQDDITLLRTELDDLCAFFEAASCRFPSMSVALQMSQTVAQLSQNPPPPDMQALIFEFRDHAWAKWR